MSISDFEFTAIEEICTPIVARIAGLIENADPNLDPDEFGTYELAIGLQSFVALHKADLAGAYPPEDEVRRWRDVYMQHFDAAKPEYWESEEDRQAMRDRFTRYFDGMISACEGY